MTAITGLTARDLSDLLDSLDDIQQAAESMGSLIACTVKVKFAEATITATYSKDGWRLYWAET